MSIKKLKEIGQGTFLHSGSDVGGGPERFGVCYYMCNFIESDKGPWNKPGTFENAVTLAKEFGKGTAMMNYAKSQNLRKAPQQNYQFETGSLKPNSIYRVELEIGWHPPKTPIPNHEVLMVTSSSNDVVYFEPNFGFFHASLTNSDNRKTFEHTIKEQYREEANEDVDSFRYRRVRSVSSALPKGFEL